MTLQSGCGAEAAIGQLTRLTSLHMSIDQMHGPAPLQLQQLGCSGTPHSAGSARRSSSNGSGGSAADSASRNTGLQELSLECMGSLSDDELAAAAGTMPGLRRLIVVGCICGHCALAGLYGARLAAFSACRRLRDISLRNAPDLDGCELFTQLPQTGSLASLQVRECLGVDSKAWGSCRQHFRPSTVAICR
jgi:hypothetical protein